MNLKNKCNFAVQESNYRGMRHLKRLFGKACARYGLLSDGDRILVAVSGGKDSLMLCRLLAEQARIFKPRIEVEAVHVVMDNVAYETDLQWLADYCQTLGMPLHILHACFDESLDRRHTRCFLCAWYRRKALFRFAEGNGFNKVALGHHQDDILSTWLMNMTYEGHCGTMRPLLQMDHYHVTVVRPLCLVSEEHIKNLAAMLELPKQKARCPYEETTRRKDMEDVLHHLERLNPEARYSLWHAMEQLQRD